MTTTTIVRSAAFLAAFALAVPAHAGQQRGGGSRGDGASQGAAVSRNGVRGGAVAPRGSVRSYPVYRGGGGVHVAPRGYYGATRGYYGAPRGYYSAPRGYYGAGYYRPYYSFRPRLSIGIGLW